ncbi:MAG: hypothetical protein L0196_03200 [candidate division Zixibacteria bacterium]|nr:hypothetical protein [candidate division Zixibacteria bacterium]
MENKPIAEIKVLRAVYEVFQKQKGAYKVLNQNRKLPDKRYEDLLPEDTVELLHRELGGRGLEITVESVENSPIGDKILKNSGRKGRELYYFILKGLVVLCALGRGKVIETKKRSPKILFAIY